MDDHARQTTASPRRRAPSLALALALAATLSACTSLPRIVPDMARSAPPPRIEAGGGPLSAERTKQILDGLAKPGGAGSPTLLDRHVALEAALDASPLVAGNKVALLEDGPSTYDAMFAAIRSAKHHVNMETYILEDDDVGRRFADALIERARHGVRVNLICDGVGTLDTPSAFFDWLKSGGVSVVIYNPVNPLTAPAGWDVNQRDHRKLLIVDGQVALLGGINISGVYSGGSSARVSSKRPDAGPPWRDTDLRVEGPVVAELQKLYIATWNAQHGPSLGEARYFPKLAARGDDVVHAIGGSPDAPYNLIYATLISAIQSAQRDVLLTNAYFVPDPQTIKALTDAAARGVDVTLILPSVSDATLVLETGRSYYGELLTHGVKIYERQSALLHAKTAVIDGVWSTVGSTNLDWRSFVHNQELNAVVLGSAFGERMRAAFERDRAASKQITLEAWQGRSIAARLKESFGRLWQYWL